MVPHTGDTGRIAIDAMSGDLGPAEVVAAVKLAFDESPHINPLTLVGAEDVLRPLLAEHGLDNLPASRLAICHASEVITMDDKPLKALRAKKDSSMVRAIELVKQGEASAVVSCGNTGALMAGGTLRLRTLDGIDRPALCAIIPRENGYFVLIDAGANPLAEPEHLAHNALLGSHYARVILGVEKPRVGLLTIGTEEGKGNLLTAGASTLLKQAGAAGILNYVGPTEGFTVFTDHCDVAVCDGFTGNLLLKSWESLLHFFSDELKTALKANPMRIAGAMLSRGAFKAIKARVNPERYGGAPLLGLRGNVLKAHGSSNRQAIKSAILSAAKIIRADLLYHIEHDAARLNAAIAPPSPVGEKVES
ncbi:phosphate acyltransferase PlsX [Geminisphaera colitermitum]|uniref:phosphate acyltransferase PlsX n=1 Tax=Geminisphaera colitermitum TaxID=1148786 RepID=UPI000158DB15|nr:phosphate acyltransferase PlsX [Geminisphaera colitermitum]